MNFLSAPSSRFISGICACAALITAARVCAQSDYATPYTFSTLVGQVGVGGYTDGTGGYALFNDVKALAVDSSGNLYVADGGNAALRMITPAGVVTTIAKLGFYPEGIAVDSAGIIYLSGANVIWKVTSGGVVSKLAGVQGALSFADGPPNIATFNNPTALAVDGKGNLYVADTNDYAIRVVSTSTGFVSTLAGDPPYQYGFADGTGTAARFDEPTGLAVDSSGNVYVSDSGGAFTIRKVTSAGVATTIAGTPGTIGGADGTGPAAQFNALNGIAIGADGNLYVTDAADTIRKVTPAGVVTTLAGTYRVAGWTDGVGPTALFNDPTGIAVDSKGNLFVADNSNQTIRESYAAPAAVPAITEQPGAQSVFAGGTATFAVSASGVPVPRYQWLYNGSPIPNATNPTLVLANTQASQVGSYSVVVTNALGSVTSSTASLSILSGASPRLLNLSTRAQVGTGGNILIPGFVISGSGTETLLIRADGPSLAQFGVTGVLAQPSLIVTNQSTGNTVATNTGWGNNSNPAQIANVASQVGAFALTAGSADCAVIVNLPAGAYTVQVSGVNNTTGIALAEVYEVSSSGTRLINISTRAQVGTGGSVIIVGLVISGSGSEELLVRGDGPALTQFGVTGALTQPSLSVLSGQTVIASNTGWGTSSNSAQITNIGASVGAFSLASGSTDSAVVVSLPAGSYTAEVSGFNNLTGVALAELYEVP